jgi:hypothetical protein
MSHNNDNSWAPREVVMVGTTHAVWRVRKSINRFNRLSVFVLYLLCFAELAAAQDPTDGGTFAGAPSRVVPLAEPREQTKQQSREKDKRNTAGPSRTTRRVSCSGWFCNRGLTTCSLIRRESCEPHKQLYPGICDDRFADCMRTGCWYTTKRGHECGIERR